MEYIAGKALRVHTDQRRSGLHITHNEGNGFFHPAISVCRGVPPKTIDAELTPACGEIGRRYLFDCAFVHLFIIAAGGGWTESAACAEGKDGVLF